MNNLIHRPLCVILSAPSGAGKTTLGARLLREFPEMLASISCTTRRRRPGEKDGRDYHFLTAAEFRRRIKTGFFLEHARVHGCCYGTPRAPIEQALAAGRDALLIIDVQGARRIRSLLARTPAAILKQALVDIFILPPDLTTLHKRLEGRGQDTAATIRRRLAKAAQEMSCWKQYRYLIINDRLDEAYARLRAIILAEHSRVPSQ